MTASARSIGCGSPTNNRTEAESHSNQTSPLTASSAQDHICATATHYASVARPMGHASHTVREGETAQALATHYGVSIDDLKVANPGLANARLMPGDVLTIPQPGAQAYRSAPPSTPVAVPTTTPAYTPAKAREEVKTLFEATEGGLTGWGTDLEKMFGVLEGKSKAEIQVLRDEYFAQYGHKMDDVLREETSGADLKRVEALLEGKENAGVSQGLAIGEEMESMWANESNVLDRLEKATPEERDAIVKAYAKQYGPPAPQQTDKEFFLSRLERKFNADEMTQARGLLNNTPEGAGAATAAKLHQALDGMITDTDTDALKAALKGKTQAEISTIKTAYWEQYGETLGGRIKHEIEMGPTRDVVMRLIDPPRTGPKAEAEASAERLHEAVDGLGTDLPAIRKELAGKTRSEIEGINRAFKDRTGETLTQRLTDDTLWNTGGETMGAEKDEVLHYLDVPPSGDPAAQARWDIKGEAIKMRVALEGMGTDEAGIRELLQGKSKEEMTQLGDAYKALYQEDLREALDSDLDGREQLELLEQLYDKGAVKPGDVNAVKEELARLQQRRDYEQDGLSFTNKMQRIFRRGETDADRMDRHLLNGQRALERNDMEAAQAEAGRGLNDLRSTISSREAVTDAAVTVAAVGAAVTIAGITYGTGTPLSVALLTAATSGAAGAASTLAVMAATNPQAGWQEISRQAAIAGATSAISFKGAKTAGEAVGNYVATKTGQAVLGHAAVAVVQGTGNGVVQAGAGGVIQTATDTDKLKGKDVIAKVAAASGSAAVAAIKSAGVTELATKGGAHASRHAVQVVRSQFTNPPPTTSP